MDQRVRPTRTYIVILARFLSEFYVLLDKIHKFKVTGSLALFFYGIKSPTYNLGSSCLLATHEPYFC
jgi:hypothetical protein